MTLVEAIKRNPYDPKQGNKSAYCRYLRYNVDGWYQLDSKEVFRRCQTLNYTVVIMQSQELQKYLTNPPIPFGGYQAKTMNDDEIKEQMNKGADRCMKMLFGEYTEHKDCREERIDRG